MSAGLLETNFALEARDCERFLLYGYIYNAGIRDDPTVRSVSSTNFTDVYYGRLWTLLQQMHAVKAGVVDVNSLELAIKSNGRDPELLQAAGELDLVNFDTTSTPYMASKVLEHSNTWAAGMHLSDLGNADRLIALHGKRLRYNTHRREWLVWDGARWALDERRIIYDMASKTVKSILHEAAEEKDSDRAKKLATWALRSQDKTQIEHMLMLAQHQVAVTMDDLDRDPWLLNCQNGTLDLKTGTLRGHDPCDMISKMVPVDYDESAKCPKWFAFLDRTMGGDTDLIRFLQRAIGYSLTGDVSEQCFFLLHGGGMNGKSVLLETIMHLLGKDYAVSTPTETVVVRRGGGDIPNDIARLKGARFVSVNEIERGRHLAESRVKQMTGGDTMTARFLHAEYFDFLPWFKLWMRANHRPVITGTDHAIWRRVMYLPFDVVIPEAERNFHLADELMLEAAGILAWAVEGCFIWQSEHLSPPGRVLAAVKDYRAEMDVVGIFIADTCKEGTGQQVTAANLYAAYSSWCERSGERPMSNKAFGQSMTERGFERGRTEAGNIYKGVGL